jgi:hypothetical protein
MKKLHLLFIMLLIYFIGANFVCNASTTDMIINNLSDEDRTVIRQELLKQLIVKYETNQTFSKVQEYMDLKFQELHKTSKPRSSVIVIEETFDKSRLLYEQTKLFVGNNFARDYDPIQIRKEVQKYLWLKGFCFAILGITDEHRAALSYFYLPENEELKQDLLKDLVLYFFPEVSDVPENKVWHNEMESVIERLGYQIFNINKFIQ